MIHPLRHNNRRPVYKIRENIILRNIFNNNDIHGDIINEEDIEGKTFYIVRSNNRVYKLAKEAHSLIKKTK
jgi:hypothetical protein